MGGVTSVVTNDVATTTSSNAASMVTAVSLPSCTRATGLVPSDVVVERSAIRAPSSHTSIIDPFPAIRAWTWTSCHTPLLIFVTLVLVVPETSFLIESVPLAASRRDAMLPPPDLSNRRNLTVPLEDCTFTRTSKKTSARAVPSVFEA